MKLHLTIKAFSAAVLAAVVTLTGGSAAAQTKPSLHAVRPEASGAYADLLSGAVAVDEASGVLPSPYVPWASKLSYSGELPRSYVTPTTGIHDQGSYNSCWAFSGIGTLEAFLSNDGKGDFDLSEQHLAWWATKNYNTDGVGWLAPGLSYGGYSMMSAGYFASWQGPKTEEDIPYVVSGNTKVPENMDDAPTVFGTTGIMYVDNDIESVKTAVMHYGGVATSFNNGSGYNYNKSAYYQSNVTFYYSGHAITIIGWDDDYSRENFDEDDRPEHDGAWLAKNSWGTNKGDEGYLWISYEDRYVLDTDVWGVNLAVTGVRNMTGYDRLYQNETYGATFYTYLMDEDDMVPTATFANIFKFDEEHPYLQEVIFETQAKGADYTVWYIPIKNGKPVADRSKWTELDRGVIDKTGYVCSIVEGKMTVGRKAAIGVTIDASGVKGGSAQLGVDEWLSNSSGDYIFMPKAQRGQSFVINGGSVYDLLDIYAENDDDIGGTLVIKAIASSDVIGDANDDSVVDTSDALTVLRETVGVNTGITQLQAENCDVDFDGSLSSMDALMILRRSLRLLAEF